MLLLDDDALEMEAADKGRCLVDGDPFSLPVLEFISSFFRAFSFGELLGESVS